MYTGRYISQQGNLGHEAINLVRADNKNFYIWLNSMGVCTQPNVEGCTVLMVRTINTSLYKVLAKAENCHLCEGANISRKKKNAGTDDKQKRAAAQNALNVKYNGKDPMKDIFHEDDMFATFCTKTVYEAKGDVYLTNDLSLEDAAHNIYYADFRMSEAMRTYVKNTHKAYTPLAAFLQADVWKVPATETEQVYSEIEEPEFNFFKLIRKDKDELSFSNALAYYIQKSGVDLFLRQCLCLDPVLLDDQYMLLREKHNIDISFFGEKNVVIIENKIDAYITADKRSKISNQINKAVDLYFSDFSDEEKDCKKEVLKNFAQRTEGDASQLSKYYLYAVAYLLSKGMDISEVEKHIKCFLLVPEYSKKQFKQDDNGCFAANFRFADKYTLMTYRDIYEFYYSHTIEDAYFADFLSAMGPLKKEFNNDLEEEMKIRFLKAIGVK